MWTKKGFKSPGNSSSSPIKWLVYFTLGISLFCAIGSDLFSYLFGSYTPGKLLSLSQWGLSKNFYWQPLTYLFVSPDGSDVSFTYFLNLAANAYMLWTAGSIACERKGSLQTYLLFFLAGTIGGVAALGAQHMFGQVAPFSGNWAGLFALILAWYMLNPKGQIFFGPGITLRNRTLLLALFWGNLLIDLASGSVVHLSAMVAGALFAYLYVLVMWRLPSEFKCLRKFEYFLLKVSPPSPRAKQEKAKRGSNKIFDIKTGRIID